MWVTRRNVKLPYEELKKMEEQGIIRLGISKVAAFNLIYRPNKFFPHIGLFILLVSYVFMGFFFYSIYLSFVEHWWWVFIGIGSVMLFDKFRYFIATSLVLHNGLTDEEFYEFVSSSSIWQFKIHQNHIDEVDAKLTSKLWEEQHLKDTAIKVLEHYANKRSLS